MLFLIFKNTIEIPKYLKKYIIYKNIENGNTTECACEYSHELFNLITTNESTDNSNLNELMLNYTSPMAIGDMGVFPPMLKKIHLDNHTIKSISKLPTNLCELIFTSSNISDICRINLGTNITILNLDNNNISKLDNIPNGLLKLSIVNNQIKKIENLPHNLQRLYLNRNQIEKMENIPLGIKHLCLAENNICKIENLPDGLTFLNLNHNNISIIENIHDGLTFLDLSHNNITIIKNIPNSTIELSLFSNNISIIENLPENLNLLHISNNKIKQIENLDKTHIINLQLCFNEISKIENIPNTTKVLSLSFNNIETIENLPPDIEVITLGNNNITNIPLNILEFRQLRHVDLITNPIENIHPLVDRWLDRVNRGNNVIYSDKQNIHNSNIQSSFRNSLENIIKDKDLANLDICKNYVVESEILTENVKRELLNYCDDKTEHSVYLITFEELFHYVMNRILKHNSKNEIMKILNEEIKDTICKCFTGRITRLLNVLNGFHSDISIQIGSNEQISNIIIMLKEKYEGKELVKQVRMAMKERDYNSEVIKEWLEFI